MTAGSLSPAIRGRAAPTPALRICPNATFAGAAILSLLLTAAFGTLAALGFLGATLALLARRPGETLGEALRFWPILLVPVWCLLTWFWSNDPPSTLRFGIQLGLTVLVAIAMAARLSPRTYLWALFTAYGLAALGSLLFGEVRTDGSGWLGIFGSKNEFSFEMSIFILVSLALVLDRRTGPRGLALALAGLALGWFLLVMGRSAGGLLSTALVAGLGVMLASLRWMPPALRLLLVVLALLGAIAAALVAWGFRDELAAAFLSATGKDVTLTGRTELWAVAFEEIARHPLLGQGFKAVWVPGHPVAEAMWTRFGIESRSGFHFHSTWISNTVEIGLIGIALQLAAFLTALVLTFRWVIAAPGAGSLFFAMLMARQTVLSLVEVVAFQQFQTSTILTVSALVFGLRHQGRAARPARASPRAMLEPSRS